MHRKTPYIKYKGEDICFNILLPTKNGGYTYSSYQQTKLSLPMTFLNWEKMLDFQIQLMKFMQSPGYHYPDQDF